MTKWTSLVLCFAAACGSTPGTDDCVDNDGDGVTTCDGDCDDSDALSNAGGNEICGDGIDNNCDGVADEACNGLGTFVSGTIGDDANPGTKASPVKTIAKGMANAAMIGNAQSVIVAQGHYPEEITLVEGIDLVGGFQCDTTSCTWARDPIANDTAILNQDFGGIVAGMGVTVATLVEGFRIMGMDGAPNAAPGSCGVQLAGGSPTLRGNRIFGGNLTGGGFPADRSAALCMVSTTDPTGAIIDHNDLTGGASTSLSAGILFDSYP